MATLAVRFTVKGEQSESTFFLQEEGNAYYLVRDSADRTRYAVQKDTATNIFMLVNEEAFEESSDIITERMVGLSEEWIEVQSQGLEADQEDSLTSRKPGYGPKDIIVNSDNYSISDLVRMVKEGDLEIAPRFQRNFVWDKTRQSRLIESIFLGLPLPAIYLSEYDDGRMTIVDGLQRISTILAFMENRLRLCNMEYFENCNGKTFSELNLPDLQLRRFHRTQITCFKIDYRSPNQLKYDLFRRLNSGGKALNDQEIRNCLSRTPVQDALHSMIASCEFRQATGNSIKDTRMAAQESALRFICFYRLYTASSDLKGYDGNMRIALDNCVEVLNTCSQQELDCYVALFQRSMAQAYALFGVYAFRKVKPDYLKERKNSVNKSLLVAVSVLLAVHAEYGEKLKDQDLTPALAALLANDPDLSNAISWGTSSWKSIYYVFDRLKTKLFDKHVSRHD